MTERIYLSPPDITQAERDAVAGAFDSGWVAPLGPDVDAFEEELAAHADRKYCVVLNSGTAALHLAMLAMGFGQGQAVMTASMTFIATCNPITYCGAEPVFVDSDEDGMIEPNLLRDAIKSELAKGKNVTGIVPVDLLGKVVDHSAIKSISEEFGLPVLSDAAESLGAKLDGRQSTFYGDHAILSFNGNKIMTTSGGGALLTNDKAVAERAKYLATQARQPVVWYEHQDIGYNYRLSNLLAAMGRAQFARLPQMIERRRQIRLAYQRLFADVDGVTMFQPNDHAEEGLTAPTHDNFWLTSVLIDPDKAGFTRDDLFQALNKANIESRPLWKPMHLQPVYAQATAYTSGVSERLFDSGLSLPSGSAISDSNYERIFSTITDFLTNRKAR